MTEAAYYVYVLECADQSYYTGVTTNPERRLREHNESRRGAKYTRSRRPVRMIACKCCHDKGDALRRERQFKSLSAKEKRVRLGDL